MVGRSISWNSASPLVRAVNDTLPLFAALATLAVLLVVVGPMRDLPAPTDDERRRIERLCASGESDLLAPFTTRHDKRYVFSPDGRAAIGYRVALGVGVAGAGPVGAPDAHAAALEAFIQRCDERGWRPAMIGASQPVRELARTMGMRGLQIGDEAIVEIAPFRLDTPPMRNARQAVKRTRNSGVTTTVHREGQLDGPTHDGLQAVAHEWRKGGGELGFAMTLDHLLDGTHGDALLFVAWHDGRPVGFQRYLLCRGGTGLSLDVMPRIRRSPNGVNERLIVDAIEWGRTHGIDEVSLNFAAFRELFESAPTAGRWAVGPRVIYRVVHLLDPFINVESLYRFNAKFHPTWYSRHVLFRSLFDVPFFLVAALRLEFSGRTPAVEPTTTPAAIHA
jgi:lysyl-tRNA synthetase class 2